MLSSGYLLSVSKDTTLQLWNLTSLSRVAKWDAYGKAIPCVKEVKPNIIAFGDEFFFSNTTHTIYFWNLTNFESPSILNQVNYTASSTLRCSHMKLYEANNLVVANGKQTIDVWTLDTFNHSTFSIGLGDNVNCIEELSILILTNYSYNITKILH